MNPPNNSNYTKCPKGSYIPTDFEQDVFFGSDIGQEARVGFSSTLKFVVDFYGNLYPVSTKPVPFNRFLIVLKDSMVAIFKNTNL